MEIVKRLTGDSAPARGVRVALAVVAFLVAVEIVFGLSLSYLVYGVVLGSLYGMIGVALILIYRTSRIINFAAGAIGAIPAIFALILDAHDKIPYLAVLPIALIGGPLFGAGVDLLVMRRFSRSPRLILTVVTIGVAQALAIVGFFIPIWLGVKANLPPNVPTPWGNSVLWRNGRGQPILIGNQVFALVVLVVLSVGLALFLRYSRIGIALRASSENAERAALLGIPVLLIGTVAWAAAGLLSSMAIFVQSPLIGLPQNVTLGFDTILYGLAAAVIARMERIGLALIAGMGIGILIQALVARSGDNSVAEAAMVVVIMVALLAQKGLVTRALDAGTSTWQTVKQFRPIPVELRDTPEVRTARATLFVAVAALVLAPPYLIHSADISLLAVVPIYGMVAVSLVILTGWAGQISLGQFGLVGAGALAAGGIISRHNIDFFAALGIGIAAGAITAVIIGLPAVRIQVLYLGVTTLAFGYAMQGYLLNSHYWVGRHLMPNTLTANIYRPVLYGRIDLADDRSFYYSCLALLALTVLGAYAFRRNRSGRVLIAARDNQRAAPAYSINLVRTRLAAFAISGGIAGMAGVLLVYQQHQVIPDSFSVLASVEIFLATVVGGLTSVGFAVSGAMIFEFTLLFGPRYYKFLGQDMITIIPLLLTGPLLVVNLYFYPGGSAEAGFGQRDTFLRWVARRHDILVPSLVADKRVEEEQQHAIVEEAERHVEEAASGHLVCPVCGASIPVAAALDHDHLRGPQPATSAL